MTVLGWERVGRLEDHERPDFLLISPGGPTIGVEVTELCRPEERAQRARLTHALSRAQQLYQARPGARTLSVAAALADSAESISVQELARSLADFVAVNHGSPGHYTRQRGQPLSAVLPDGVLSVAIHNTGGRSHWQGMVGFRSTLAERELVERRIQSKNAQVPDYKKLADQVILLIVNDQSIGAGEVAVDEVKVAGWRFSTAFDRVLVFARNIGGGGQVFELRIV